MLKDLWLGVKNLLALALDGWRFMTAATGPATGYTKFRIIRRLRDRLGSTAFIETGTLHGTMARRCARIFREVYTIELDPALAQKASRYLADRPQVSVIQGDGAQELAKLFAGKPIRKAIVFLDGHYSGPGTAHGQVSEPALEELKDLAAARAQIDAIVIDDYRCFGEPGLPRRSELWRLIEQNFESSQFETAVYSDQLIIARRRPSEQN